LASSIPDLKLDSSVVEVKGSDFEIDTNSGKEALIEDVIGESEQKTGLADSRVTDKEKLEEVIVILIQTHEMVRKGSFMFFFK
jgi:hypothetical protein